MKAAYEDIGIKQGIQAYLAYELVAPAFPFIKELIQRHLKSMLASQQNFDFKDWLFDTATLVICRLENRLVAFRNNPTPGVSAPTIEMALRFLRYSTTAASPCVLIKNNMPALSRSGHGVATSLLGAPIWVKLSLYSNISTPRPAIALKSFLCGTL